MEGEESVRSDSYMITHPGVFVEETPETVCTKFLQETPEVANLTVRLFPEKYEDSRIGSGWLFSDSNEPAVQLESRLGGGERDKCLQVSLPKSAGAAMGLLEIEISSEDGSLDTRIFREISIYRQKVYPMIQTDKGHYKARDQVKFRLLVLDQNLKPPDDLRTIEEIWVEDPRNRRVAQWKEVSVELGLVQREFRLSEEPVLGQYRILAAGSSLEEETTFTVSEYVLPKFQLLLAPPPAVVRDAELTTFKVSTR